MTGLWPGSGPLTHTAEGRSGPAKTGAGRSRLEKTRRWVDDDATGADVDLGQESGDEWHHHVVLLPSPEFARPPADDEEVLAEVPDFGHDTDLLAVRRDRGEPDQFMIIELVAIS